MGIPFDERRQDLEACSCWGLVRLVLLREARIPLPKYDDCAATSARAAQLIEAGWRSEDWTVVSEPRLFDVAILRASTWMDGALQRTEGHVGVMVSPERLLHVERASHSVHVAVTHPLIRRRVLRYCRHRSLV